MSGSGRDPGPVVRPYALTGGRTRPVVAEHLEVETLVSVTDLGESRMASMHVDWRPIAVLCREVVSVAEVSAHLDVPLGVARVFVGDMAARGLVSIHRPPSANGSQPDHSLLARVLSGLQGL